MQHANRMRHIILSSLVCLGVPYFSTLPLCHKRRYFRGKKVIEHTVCILIFVHLLLEKFQILRRI